MSTRSRIAAADCRLVVSRLWQDWLRRERGHYAHQVRNGVDMSRFSPTPDATDAALRAYLKLPRGACVFLAIGGVEERKNTIRLLDAFRMLHAHRMLHAQRPASCLVIAGGASLLDHDRYQARFAQALAQSGLPEGAVIRLGPWPQELMPALYRAANTLVFPSTKEGFGLVVLEAMASGVPVVTSRIAPFTEYLGEPDVVWCDPFDPASIAAAMAASCEASVGAVRREHLVARGLAIAARHDWNTTAQTHLAIYGKLMEAVRA
jgi:glycosyltransferase-like protein